MKKIGRRSFLKAVTITALGSTVLKVGTPYAAAANETSLKIPKRPLGKTGFDATIVALGGQSTIEQPGRRDEAVAIINRALDRGINYIDTAEAYGNGTSESYIGEVMRDRRDEVFLATKIGERTQNGIENDRFEKSCERLQTDFVDLYFMHAVNSLSHLNTALDRDQGAIKAFERLREKGRIGNIGISSHSIEVLDEALRRYDFDVIFLTINPAGMNMNQSAKATRDFLAKVAEKDVGVVGMKLTGRNRIFGQSFTISMEQCMKYALSSGCVGDKYPISTAAIGITSVDQIDENVGLASRYTPCDEAELERLEALASG